MIWQHVVEELSLLARRIEGFIDGSPDVIVSIVPGGMVPARILASKLAVTELYGLTVSPGSSGEYLSSEITSNLSGKKTVLVESIITSGAGINLAKGYLESQGADVSTASLYQLSDSAFKPDCLLGELTEVITFPWD